ncbi:MAG TPA: DUF4260 domain-containing protein [Edaphobacter sp.]
MLTRPSLLLKLEYATLSLAAILIYHHLHYSGLLFAVLFLAPDLSMLGYLANPSTGSAIYNLGHTLVFPLTLSVIAYATQHQLLTAMALIWITHIALDRLLGYGLKYPTFFKDTHLQHIP